VFSIAYVILPLDGAAPAEAIRASLAPFQRGGRGDVPDGWLTFHDETAALRRAHEASFTFTENRTGGLRVEGDHHAYWSLDTGKVQDEMRRRGIQRWSIRFADAMDLEAFHAAFTTPLERHPETGGYGRWLNPLGRWDWWDLGGRFDGRIIGEPARGAGRSAAQISSGESRGRSILANIAAVLEDALGQPPAAELDVRSDRNIELVATLLTDAQAGRDHAYPSALVLPPSAAEDRLRWLDTWPDPGPAEAFAWLGLPPDAGWPAVVEAAYARFADHWAAGVAYHL
jgi:hypothetical protein